MKLEQQVSSLELSKKLKALGVKQESAFVHCLAHKSVILRGLCHQWGDEADIAAFTVSELGEMLPHEINRVPINFFTTHNIQLPSLRRHYVVLGPTTKPDYETCADTEADARAKMLIHLIEKGIVKP